MIVPGSAFTSPDKESDKDDHITSVRRELDMTAPVSVELETAMEDEESPPGLVPEDLLLGTRGTASTGSIVVGEEREDSCSPRAEGRTDLPERTSYLLVSSSAGPVLSCLSGGPEDSKKGGGQPSPSVVGVWPDVAPLGGYLSAQQRQEENATRHSTTSHEVVQQQWLERERLAAQATASEASSQTTVKDLPEQEPARRGQSKTDFGIVDEDIFFVDVDLVGGGQRRQTARTDSGEPEFIASLAHAKSVLSDVIMHDHSRRGQSGGDLAAVPTPARQQTLLRNRSTVDLHNNKSAVAPPAGPPPDEEDEGASPSVGESEGADRVDSILGGRVLTRSTRGLSSRSSPATGVSPSHAATVSRSPMGGATTEQRQSGPAQDEDRTPTAPFPRPDEQEALERELLACAEKLAKRCGVTVEDHSGAHHASKRACVLWTALQVLDVCSKEIFENRRGLDADHGDLLSSRNNKVDDSGGPARRCPESKGKIFKGADISCSGTAEGGRHEVLPSPRQKYARSPGKTKSQAKSPPATPDRPPRLSPIEGAVLSKSAERPRPGGSPARSDRGHLCRSYSTPKLKPSALLRHGDHTSVWGGAWKNPVGGAATTSPDLFPRPPNPGAVPIDPLSATPSPCSKRGGRSPQGAPADDFQSPASSPSDDSDRILGAGASAESSARSALTPGSATLPPSETMLWKLAVAEAYFREPHVVQYTVPEGIEAGQW